MPRFEYKLVPAPERATRHKGLKGVANFAATLEDLMNEMGRDGWHYLRADVLPQEERSGLTSKVTTYRNLLVFQRELPEDPAPKASARPAHRPVAEPAVTDDVADERVDDEASLANLFADPDAPPDPPVPRKP